MSSLLDAVIHSDVPDQDARSVASTTTQSRRRARSSSRQQGPPSVSTPGVHSDMPGFEDDEVVGTRGLRAQRRTIDVPPTMDVTAERLAQHFQTFLEEYVPVLPADPAGC